MDDPENADGWSLALSLKRLEGEGEAVSEILQ